MTHRMYGMKSGGARNGDLSLCAQGFFVFFLLYGSVPTASNSDGTIHIDTPYSRLLGKPPIMIASMTPSTVKAGFVSAILSAGFNVELAGDGHYSPDAIRAKVAKIQSQIPAGVGITPNSLYINPVALVTGDEQGGCRSRASVSLWAFQAPRKLLRSLMG